MVIGNARLQDGMHTLVLHGGKIAGITDEALPVDLDAAGCRVIPGLIDVHTHGGGGMDTMDGDLAPLRRFYAAHGTTAFLPTTMTAGCEELLRVTGTSSDGEGAAVLGFHLEGPYIAPSRKGAQNEAYIRNPDIAEFSRFSGVKMITMAPELPGAMAFIREASKRAVVALGHTGCDYRTAKEAFACGASCLSHTFNAMPPLLHREPGPIGAGVEVGCYAQLICDGLHVAKAAVLAAYRMFGSDRLILISDSIRPAGMPDGEYVCGGLPVTLKQGEARLHDGTLAGSAATLWDCVKQAVAFGISFDEAVKMATATPAALLGVPKGQIREGYDADLLIVDDDLQIRQVILSGVPLSPLS